MKPIAINKTLDPADYALLKEELVLVDACFTKEREQHPHRRWEYAMALRAVEHQFCCGCDLKPRQFYDVGGAGSPLRHMLATQGHGVLVVDPDERPSPTSLTLHDFVATDPPLVDGVFCLSVIEHVPPQDLKLFLCELILLLKPGGLLVLTFDCCDCAVHNGGLETHHFNWMRQQIFKWPAEPIYEVMNTHGMPTTGGVDPVYHGNHVYDYTFGVACFFKLD